MDGSNYSAVTVLPTTNGGALQATKTLVAYLKRFATAETKDVDVCDRSGDLEISGCSQGGSHLTRGSEWE